MPRSRRRRGRMSQLLLGTGVAVLLAAAAALGIGVAGDAEPLQADTAASDSSTPAESNPPAPAATGTAFAQLETIPIKGKAPQTGYDRDEKFGNGWLDTDRNGCDTRNDMLARDLTDIAREGPCTVLTGDLVSPYTGETIEFVRGNETSMHVQVDHVVALSNAWQTGAQQLSQEDREAFANDPLNLLAVDGTSNQQKGDGDAATWLPPKKDFRCDYIARQVAVKAKYGLWMTQAEHGASIRVLSQCPEQPALY
ncbi:HNH endonuclease family protein [Diaminobutyricimonas sp. TR449]|uniref:HNH endonuclease family protein n=1 Tax=Diaminobutyricimonas sp. TR449 TaxID=2708076 RepID=UPI003265EAD4